MDKEEAQAGARERPKENHPTERKRRRKKKQTERKGSENRRPETWSDEKGLSFVS